MKLNNQKKRGTFLRLDVVVRDRKICGCIAKKKMFFDSMCGWMPESAVFGTV